MEDQTELLPPSPNPYSILDLSTKKSQGTPPPICHQNNNTLLMTPHGGLGPNCQCSTISTSDTYSENSNDINSRTPTLQSPSSKSRTPRPFKAYTKNPLDLVFGVSAKDLGCDPSQAESFAEFRNKMLARVQANSGTNKNMRRIGQGNQTKIDDPNYWEKRRKNNEAAKRSRDARRAKEDEIAIRCAFLEKENIQLKYKIAALEADKKAMEHYIYHRIF